MSKNSLYSVLQIFFESWDSSIGMETKL